MPELMTCPDCRCTTLIQVRSVEDTFHCSSCGAWKPCYPTREQVQQAEADHQRSLQDQRDTRLS